jgi:predicted peptidase
MTLSNIQIVYKVNEFSIRVRVSFILGFAVLFLLPETGLAGSTDTLRGHAAIGTHSLPFTLLTLHGGNNTSPVPLLLFLHGAGERGADNRSQLNVGLPTLVKSLRALPGMQDCRILIPQCPENERWVDSDWTLPHSTMKEQMTWALKGCMQVLDSLIKHTPQIDSNRIYITGYSMGGFGCWELLQRFPQKFAAGIPVCGGGDTLQVQQLRAIPI